MNENEKVMLYIKECAELVGLEVIKGKTAFSITFMAEVMKRLREKQEPRKGHWIIHGEPPINVIECSECGQKYHNHYCQPLAHFCSMCGCRMVEPQESEVEE